MYRWRARAADDKTIGKCNTATHVVPVVIERNVVAEDAGSHDVVQLGKLDLSRALQELGVRLDQLHGLDVLGSGNVALVNSLHLRPVVTLVPMKESTKQSRKQQQLSLPSLPLHVRLAIQLTYIQNKKIK